MDVLTIPKEVMVERYVDKHFYSSSTSLERKQAFEKIPQENT